MVDQQDIEDNLTNVKYIVRRSENPHPMTLIAIVVITLMVICYIYKTFLKPNISGIWQEDNGSKYTITHNKWDDSLSVDGAFYGVIRGNLVAYYVRNKLFMGIWLNDTIEWTDGSRWVNTRGY